MKSYRTLITVVALMTVVLTSLFAAPAQASGYCAVWHTVQRGENLYRISIRYNVSMATIASLNNLNNWNYIYAGQRLCISGQNPNPNPGGTVYVVQPGDGLYRIAQRFGVNMWVLARVNNIWNVNYIYVGQVLRIPDVTIQ